MQSIGERLEEARKRRGITIREAAEATKIRGEYLSNFENDQFEINIPDIYVQGFLRSYANYLKLNADKLLADFRAEQLGAPAAKTAKRDRREFFGRVEMGEPIVPEKPAHAGKVVDEEVQEEAAEPGEPFWARFWRDLDKEMALKVAAIGGGALLLILVLVWIFSAIVGSGEGEAQPVASQLDPLIEEATSPDTVKLIANGDLRVTVVQDEPRQILYDGPLAEGEVKEIEKNGRIVITYSEGSNLVVETADGRRFGMPVDGRGRSPIP